MTSAFYLTYIQMILKNSYCLKLVAPFNKLSFNIVKLCIYICINQIGVENFINLIT